VDLSQTQSQRDSMATNLRNYKLKCTRLEATVTEGFKELVKERREKQLLEVRVEEMQTSIEQQIHHLRERLDNSDRGKDNLNDPLKEENKRLREGLQDMKVSSPFHAF
jgi:hypothetical protein